MKHLGLSATLATSGGTASKGNGFSKPLQPSIRLINECDLIGTPNKLGAGRFGTCYSQRLSHFEVCVKVFKHDNLQSFSNEANILTRFKSENLPFLFGVLLGTSKRALVTSFHGIEGISVTLHIALSTKSPDILTKYSIEWKPIVQQIVTGVEELHVKHRVLHNDLKSDNIVLAQSGGTFRFYPVIVDFGKACDASSGKYYRLSLQERERYKVDHPQIAPDLRDGECKQTEASDIYSFGRIVSRINVAKKIQGWPFFNDMINQCMMYNSALRPSISEIRHRVTASVLS